MTPQEFSAKIKSKYPQYKNIDDVELSKKIVEKHPEYKNQVSFEPSTLSKIGKFLTEPPKAVTPEQKSSVEMIEGLTSPLEGIAKLGRKASEGWEQIGGLMGKTGIPGAETAGKVVSGAASFLMPKNKLEAAMLPLMIEGKAASKIPEAEQAITKVLKPGPIAKAIGEGMTVTTGIPSRYTSAVAKDTSILSDATPTIKEVSKEYTNVFDRLKIKYDSSALKKYLNQSFFPNPTETSKITKFVGNVSDKIESGASVDVGEAFTARSAASSLKRGGEYRSNPSLKKYVDQTLDKLDTYIEQSGIPEIKDLSAKYFRAVAKEHFQPLFPQTKNLSPNAIRSLIMFKQLSQGAGHFLRGEYGPAIEKGFQGAAMSPLAVGSALRAGKGAVEGLASPKVPPALARLLRRKETKKLNDIRDSSNPK